MGRPGGTHDGMPDRPTGGYEEEPRADQQDAYEAHLNELEGELPVRSTGSASGSRKEGTKRRLMALRVGRLDTRMRRFDTMSRRGGDVEPSERRSTLFGAERIALRVLLSFGDSLSARARHVRQSEQNCTWAVLTRRVIRRDTNAATATCTW